jgi:7,8-dihydropterin-6-yl-methyl-4-(beta-D-ribofuranosyl)aminobenzene 5'-phosphate synthase
VCDSADASGADAAAAAPREVEGTAVDPVALEPVDKVHVTVLVDNVFDALLTSDQRTTRYGFGPPSARAPQFESGLTSLGLQAEHGFSALVTVVRDGRRTTLLFDTGLSPDAMVTNADRIGVDLGQVNGVVLSHGHFDHAGGLAGLAGRLGRRRLPIVLHPRAWTRRRTVLPGGDARDMPTLSRRALTAEGFEVVERREPSLLADSSILITGEVDRTTEYERGMPPAHQAWTGSGWEHDPTVIDDQALVVHLRGRGLVVLTGCSHAGAINILRHARRLTGTEQVHALVGGLHLSGPWFGPVVAPTVDALLELGPELVSGGHCTGWRAQNALATAFPDAWVPSNSGTTHHLRGATA